MNSNGCGEQPWPNSLGRPRIEVSLPLLFSIPPLRIARLLFELRPAAPLHLPPEVRGNVLRGAFGTVFQRSVCLPGCPGVSACSRRDLCAYAMLFEPQWRVAGPNKRIAEAPRAFLFRPPRHPDPAFGPDAPLRFELRLFGQAIEVFPFFLNAFQQISRQGLQGVSVALSSVHALDWAGSPQAALLAGNKAALAQPFVFTLEDLPIPPLPSGPVQIDFLSPTWLRHQRQDQDVPTLEALACRLRDRLAFLLQLYEQHEWQADYGTIGRLAAGARTISARGAWRQCLRRSSHTGQIMPLAGFAGTVSYENIHPAVWPLLVIGQQIHVGRQAVWGSGEYRLVSDP